jgi:hypothetical protein
MKSLLASLSVALAALLWNSGAAPDSTAEAAVTPMVLPASAGEIADAPIRFETTLRRNGQPVTAICDVEFSLWTDAEAGIQHGSRLQILRGTVTNGVLDTSLDFGPQAPLSANWVELALRCGDEQSLTTLKPRIKASRDVYSAR